MVYVPGDSAASPPPNFSFAGQAFVLAVYRSIERLDNFVFAHPIEVTVGYADEALGGMEEVTLLLHYWDGSSWMDAATSCTPTSVYQRDLANNLLRIKVCHFTPFALHGQEGAHIYMPVALK